MSAPVPTRIAENFTRRSIALWLGAISVLSAFAAWFYMMTGFLEYDDEGTLMITVKQYLAGGKIYDQVLTLYGPFYYLYQRALHTLTAAPVTHDFGRMHAVFPWVCVTLLSACIALRLTRSLALAALAQFGVSLIVVFFREEPGHPQELTLLLLMALAAAPVLLRIEQRRTALMILLGALSAALLLIKINIGALVVATLAAALLSGLSRNRVTTALGWAAGAGCTILPLMLMRNHLPAAWALSYCWLAAASIAACVCLLMRTPVGTPVTVRDCMNVVGGFAVTFAGVLAILHLQGVTMAAMFHCLVRLPSQIFLQHSGWFLPPALLSVTPLWALLGLAGAAFVAIRQPVPGTSAWRALVIGKALFSVLAILTIPLHRHLITVVSPFAWLILFNPAAGGDDAGQLFPRRLLAILTAVQILYAYPFAGSQSHFIQVLLWTTAIVCAGDSLAWLIEFWGARKRLANWGRIAAVAMLLAVTMGQAGLAAYRYRKYAALPSLDLPGARVLHMDPSDKANLQWLARSVVRECDSFESLPGLASLNFWTGIEPLTFMNGNGWIIGFTPEQERQVIAAMASHPRACVIYNRPLKEFQSRGAEALARHPLAVYMFSEFRPFGHSGDYYLLLRKERVPVADGSIAW